MNTWLRWYHGTITDPKWRVIALKAGTSIPVVIAIWAAILENASASEKRGTLTNWNPEDIAACFDVTVETVVTVCNAMQQKVLSGDTLAAWEKRNPKRERTDDSTERVQRFRDRKRHVTPSNAMKRPDKIREDKRRVEDKEEKNPPADAAANSFCEAHQKNLGAPYPPKRSDFVKLAEIRKAHNIAARASPDGWTEAVENYFASPLSSYTLADLAARFPTFKNSRLDRFGKPVNHANATGGNDGKTKTDRNREAAERLRARLDFGDRGSGYS